MTSVLEAVAAMPSDVRRTAALVSPPAGSEAGIRLALQLRDTPADGSGRIVLFVPAAPSADASPTAGEALCGLLDLHEGPVLVMDLRADPQRASTPTWLAGLADDDQLRDRWGGAEITSNSAALSRPLVKRAGSVVYASSPQFAARLEDARSRYAYTLCIGDAIPRSMATLIVAGIAVGVVLSVVPGRTTRTELHRVTAQLRRARATLLGFVVDPGGARQGAVR